MNPQIITDKGWTEIVIDDNCEWEKFYKTAASLQNDFHLTFKEKVFDFDSAYWDFNYKTAQLTLHYNIYTGVSIFPSAFEKSTLSDNELATEIGLLVFEKVA